MSTVDKVEALVAQERHLTPLESKYWCNEYKQLCFELAVQVDMLRTQIYQMQYAKIEAVVVPDVPRETVEKPTQDKPLARPLSKSEATSIRMKKWWKDKKARK